MEEATQAVVSLHPELARAGSKTLHPQYEYLAALFFAQAVAADAEDVKKFRQIFYDRACYEVNKLQAGNCN